MPTGTELRVCPRRAFAASPRSADRKRSEGVASSGTLERHRSRHMNRAHYQDTIQSFLECTPDAICGALANRSEYSVERPQLQAWREQVELLQQVLAPYAARGHVFFEFVLPRIGRRIDVVLVIDQLVFVLEFKVGEAGFQRHAVDQVWDYALDLKNFHESSHRLAIVPVLVATRATAERMQYKPPAADGVYVPLTVGPKQLASAIDVHLRSAGGEPIKGADWAAGRYSPTPNIIEAARALYSGHSVAEIARSDAGATNLTRSSAYVRGVIADAQRESRKVVCLLTGVPGAGKTLVGLDIATRHMDAASALYSVFLSGNGPLVAILREALVRDQVRRERQSGRSMTKAMARRHVEAFIQNVHHFRDDCVIDPQAPPEHVAIFDEAQRAWNREQTTAFMTRKKGQREFDASEPEFLLACMDRHIDWAVVLCLVGGGQEINTGEAGIAEWLNALRTSFAHWSVRISPRLHDSEYASGAERAELSIGVARPGAATGQCDHRGPGFLALRALARGVSLAGRHHAARLSGTDAHAGSFPGDRGDCRKPLHDFAHAAPQARIGGHVLQRSADQCSQGACDRLLDDHSA